MIKRRGPRDSYENRDKESYIRSKVRVLKDFSIKATGEIYNKLNNFDSKMAMDNYCRTLIKNKLDNYENSRQ